MVQTIGKIYPGGLIAGLFNAEYDAMFPLIKADIEPTARGISIDIIRALLFRIFIYWETF